MSLQWTDVCIDQTLLLPKKPISTKPPVTQSPFTLTLIDFWPLPNPGFRLFCRMYDVDGNGVIDQDEMTKIVQAIYDMLGAGATKPTDSAEERAKNIFSRMDENGDGHLTEEEFLRGCLQDDELSKMLAPNVVQ